MRFQRRGGRKRIVAPDGSELAPARGSQPDGTLVKALAPAWRWAIVEQTFDGRTAQTLMLARLEQPLPASWEEWGRLLSARRSY